MIQFTVRQKFTLHVWPSPLHIVNIDGENKGPWKSRGNIAILNLFGYIGCSAYEDCRSGYQENQWSIANKLFWSNNPRETIYTFKRVS